MKNKQFLKNLRNAEQDLSVSCNAGVAKASQLGNLGEMESWYMPDGIANILSQHQVEQKYRVTYDSWDGFYVVHHPKGPVKFCKDHQGLPFIDMTDSSHEAAILLVQTVRGNYAEGFTKKEVAEAKVARRQQGMMGAVSEKDYRGLVSSHMLKNNNVSPAAVSDARTLFGPDLANVRGETVRIRPDPVVENYVAIPRDFVLANKHLTLAADVFFVDGIPFLLTLSRRVKFVTAEHCPVRTAVALSNHMKKVLRVYNRAGFTVRYVLMDGEFEKVKAQLPSIVCNTTAAKEHVAEAERQIRTVKERSRGSRYTLPFSSIPNNE